MAENIYESYEMQQAAGKFTYEIQIWTLQDTFIKVLKWAYIDVKGQIQNPEVTLSDDGTREFGFSIPKFYYVDGVRMSNPMWHKYEELPIEANMHKLKVIFNKDTEDEAVEEFLVTSVTETHEQDNITIEVSSEGLAFHELGKIGYKISLSSDDFVEESYNWFKAGMDEDEPKNNIQYWNDKIFKFSSFSINYGLTSWEEDNLVILSDNDMADKVAVLSGYDLQYDKEGNQWIMREDAFLNLKGVLAELREIDEPTLKQEQFLKFLSNMIKHIEDSEWKYTWRYKVQMDWSSYSWAEERQEDIIYEDEYVSSWETNSDYEFFPAENGIERFKEKLRYVEAEESNIYNITQDIAQAFGVFCRYEYEYDDSYHIIGKNVVYYNNYWQETSRDGEKITTHLDLTYPYSSSSIKRTIDNTDVITKMFVQSVEDDSNVISIMDVLANKSREDYLLNFDYLHQVGTISDEQYAEIQVYESKMHILNEQLVYIQEQISVLQQQLPDIQAAITFYTNAIQQDDEQYNNEIAARNACVGGETDIEITGVTTKGIMVREDSAGDRGYYIDVIYEGLQAGTVKIYGNHNSKTGELSEPAVGVCKFDEFNNVASIDNLQFSGDVPNYVYLTGFYSPYNCHDKIAQIWADRKNQDTAELEEALKKEERILWYLYGARADYARIDAAHVGGESLDIVAAVGDRDNPNSPTLGACRVWGKDTVPGESNNFEDVENYTPELVWTEEQLLLEKEKLIAAFEQLMGPALREGYWTPEDYTDYGDKYIDSFTIGNDESNRIVPNNSLLSFKWDNNLLFEGEESVIYQSSVDGTMEQYLMIDLSDCLDKIAPYLDDLSFIYYDNQSINNMQDLIDQVNPSEYTLTGTFWDEIYLAQLEMQMLHEDLYPKPYDNLYQKSQVIRSFTIGASCEFGFIRDLNDEELMHYKPVLILTGSKLLTAEEIASIVDPNNRYKPFLGIYKAEVNDNNKVTITTEEIISNLSFILPSTFNSRGMSVGEHTKPEEYSIQRVYPRIIINSLKLKDTEEDLLINLNSSPLTQYEDYSVLFDSRGDTSETYTAAYYITLKPAAILYQKYQRILLDIQFVLSNADVAIYLDAIKVMKENAFPKVSYDIELCALDYKLIRTAYNKLNHIVHINDVDLQLEDVCGYISSITIPLDKVWETTAEIKNYETKFEDLFSTIVAQTEAMQKNEYTINNIVGAFSPFGDLRQDTLQNSIMKADLTYSFNQGNLTIDQANGIWGTSDAGVVAFRGGGIFTATSKDADGNWKWNTGILPTGINANLITTGQLDTNKIRIFAGNQIQFQLNSEGLFAYKSFFASGSSEAVQIDEKVDASQYVVFNQEGLFLTAKLGAKIENYKCKIDDKGNETWSTEWADINKADVDRVEISWKGLILRNNENRMVFYADNDGNLNLEGTITANSGSVGGWIIGEHSLQSKKTYKTYVDVAGETQDIYPSCVILDSNPEDENLTMLSLTNDYGQLLFDSSGLSIKGNITGSTISGSSFTTSGTNGSCTIDADGSVIIKTANKDKNAITMQYGQENITLGVISVGLDGSYSSPKPYIRLAANANITDGIVIHDEGNSGSSWSIVDAGASSFWKNPAYIKIGSGTIELSGMTIECNGDIMCNSPISCTQLDTTCVTIWDENEDHSCDLYLKKKSGVWYIYVLDDKGNEHRLAYA